MASTETITLLHGDLDDSWLNRLEECKVVAADTETGGLDWRNDRLHLVQLHAPEVGTLLIRRVEDAMPRLGSLLENDGVTKIFHFAPFDLRFLSQVHRGPVGAVRCTKAAAKLLDPGAERGRHSLATLLQETQGIRLDKGRVRVSDWGTDTLSAEQLTYAARDVQFLIDLFTTLNGRIDEADLRGMYDAICAYLPVDAALETRGFPDPLRY